MVSAHAARGSGPAKNDCRTIAPDQCRNKTKLGKKTPTDSVYRAALIVAHDLDSTPEPNRANAAVALAATLERHGVRLASHAGKAAIKPIPGIIETENGEGIVISTAGEERAADWAAISRQNRWKLAHLINFAPRALTIRTVAV